MVKNSCRLEKKKISRLVSKNKAYILVSDLSLYKQKETEKRMLHFQKRFKINSVFEIFNIIN